MDQDSLGGPAPLGQVELDDLLREVLVRVEGALDEKERLRLLLDAVVTMAADLSLDGVLARIVAIAGALVDARYAALGVLGGGADRRLRTFIHHGIGDEQAAVIGDLPTGHGLLGLIIDRPETLRLHDIAEHPSSYGFPAEHPQMHSASRSAPAVGCLATCTSPRSPGPRTSPRRTRRSWWRWPPRPAW